MHLPILLRLSWPPVGPSLGVLEVTDQEQTDPNWTAGKNFQGPWRGTGTQNTAQVPLARESPTRSLLLVRVTENKSPLTCASNLFPKADRLERNECPFL